MRKIHDILSIEINEIPLKAKSLEKKTSQGICGLDGTRTRDLRRDRAAF
jgi:hypothetical protein